jgi:hypothetical protein
MKPQFRDWPASLLIELFDFQGIFWSAKSLRKFSWIQKNNGGEYNPQIHHTIQKSTEKLNLHSTKRKKIQQKPPTYSKLKENFSYIKVHLKAKKKFIIALNWIASSRIKNSFSFLCATIKYFFYFSTSSFFFMRTCFLMAGFAGNFLKEWWILKICGEFQKFVVDLEKYWGEYSFSKN